MHQVLADMAPFADFETACRAVLDFLSDQYRFDLWMMTRTEGDDWVVLQARDRGYGVSEGTVFRWSDSFCSRMVLAQGPMVADDVAEVSVYSNAPIAAQVAIGAYIGVPVVREDGTLFGTLCAIDPRPRDQSMEEALPAVRLLGQLLGMILSRELKAVELERMAERNRVEATTDVLTGVLNRRGWEVALAAEEERSRRYGSPVCIAIIDLDDLKAINDSEGHDQGDELIRRAAAAIESVVRDVDTVARIGGDEFGLMAVECDSTAAGELMRRVRDALSYRGVRASVGMAPRHPVLGLAQAVVDADRLMYEDKKGS